jgi:hypothetical protein
VSGLLLLIVPERQEIVLELQCALHLLQYTAHSIHDSSPRSQTGLSDDVHDVIREYTHPGVTYGAQPEHSRVRLRLGVYSRGVIRDANRTLLNY